MTTSLKINSRTGHSKVFANSKSEVDSASISSCTNGCGTRFKFSVMLHNKRSKWIIKSCSVLNAPGLYWDLNQLQSEISVIVRCRYKVIACSRGLRGKKNQYCLNYSRLFRPIMWQFEVTREVRWKKRAVQAAECWTDSTSCFISIMFNTEKRKNVSECEHVNTEISHFQNKFGTILNFSVLWTRTAHLTCCYQQHYAYEDRTDLNRECFHSFTCWTVSHL